MDKKKILLIDGMAITCRAFFGIPNLSTKDGFQTNAIYGFMNMMMRFIDEEKPDYMTVAFDVHAPTFRHELYADYKGNRNPMPDTLHIQAQAIQEVLKAMNVPVVEKAGLEADDYLGTIARYCEKNYGDNLDITIITGDKDLLQIASDKTKIGIVKTGFAKAEIKGYYAKDVIAEYDITPTQFIDQKALMGDNSDNYPGVMGVGPKTAMKLVKEYGTVEEIVKKAEEGAVTPKKLCEKIVNDKEMALLCKVLAEIKTDNDLSEDVCQYGAWTLNKAKIHDMFNTNVKELFHKYELTKWDNMFL